MEVSFSFVVVYGVFCRTGVLRRGWGRGSVLIGVGLVGGFLLEGLFFWFSGVCVM